MSPAQTAWGNALADWAVRRDRRLFYRTLTEYLRPGTDGGVYQCPVGTFSPVPESLDHPSWHIQIRPGLRWATGDATLNGYDVSRRLWTIADPADPSFRADWAGLLRGITLPEANGVEFELRHTHVRPEALLQTRLAPYSSAMSAGQAIPTNGPFLLPAAAASRGASAAASPPAGGARGNSRFPRRPRTSRKRRFSPIRSILRRVPAQPKELVERCYPLGVQAIRA